MDVPNNTPSSKMYGIAFLFNVFPLDARFNDHIANPPDGKVYFLGGVYSNMFTTPHLSLTPAISRETIITNANIFLVML